MARATASPGSAGWASAADVKRILGQVDEAKLLAIVDLQPSIADLEQAMVWLGGDTDIYGASPPLKGIASRIVTILTADEEEISEAR